MNAGTVKSYNPNKGFGFIISEDKQELFCHYKSLADGNHLKEGDIVTFDIEPSTIKPGQMQCVNIKGGTGGKNSGPIQLVGGRPGYGGWDQQKGKGNMAGKAMGKGEGTGACEGMVKSFNPNKGFGFITTEDGSDLFLHHKVCVPEGIVPVAGDWVTYDLAPSDREEGKFIAVNVCGGTGSLGSPNGYGGDAGSDSDGSYGGWSILNKAKGKGKGFGSKSFGFMKGFGKDMLDQASAMAAKAEAMKAAAMGKGRPGAGPYDFPPQGTDSSGIPTGGDWDDQQWQGEQW